MKHLKLLKALNIAIGLFTLVAGTLFLVLFALPIVLPKPEHGDPSVLVFLLFGILAFLLMGAVAAVHGYAGLMVSAGRGRPLQTFLALMQLTSFPLGTLYALYALWVCWMNEPTRAAFDSPGGRRIQ